MSTSADLRCDHAVVVGMAWLAHAPAGRWARVNCIAPLASKPDASGSSHYGPVFGTSLPRYLRVSEGTLGGTDEIELVRHPAGRPALRVTGQPVSKRGCRYLASTAGASIVKCILNY